MSFLKNHHNDSDGLLVEALERSWDEIQERAEGWTTFMAAMGFALPSEATVDRFVEKIQTWQKLRRRYWRKDFATIRATPLSEKVLCGLPLNENLPFAVFAWNAFIASEVRVVAALQRRDGSEYPATYVWEQVSRHVVGFRGTAGDCGDYLGVDEGEAPREWTLVPLSLTEWSDEHAPFLRDNLNGQWFEIAFHEHGKQLVVDKYCTECHLYDAHEPQDDIWMRISGDVDLRHLLACFELRGAPR